MTTAEKSEELTTIDQLLDALQLERGWKTDTRIAEELQVSQQRVASWRSSARNRRFPSDESCVQIATALNVEPGVVLTIVGAERARGTAAESAWRSLRRFAASSSKRAQEISRQIARAAALGLLGAAAQMPLFSSPAHASSGVSSDGSVYIKSTRRRGSKAA